MAVLPSKTKLKRCHLPSPSSRRRKVHTRAESGSEVNVEGVAYPLPRVRPTIPRLDRTSLTVTSIA
jgi:hypothetical protein